MQAALRLTRALVSPLPGIRINLRTMLCARFVGLAWCMTRAVIMQPRREATLLRLLTPSVQATTTKQLVGGDLVSHTYEVGHSESTSTSKNSI